MNLKENMESKLDEFIDIPGYGNYEINPDGVIRLKRRHRGGRSDYVTKTVNKAGYYVVNLRKDTGKWVVELLHRLIGMVFIPNPGSLRTINHIDGNKLNNNINNLEWCSDSHNISHAYSLGLSKRSRPVMCVDTGEIFRSECDAARLLGIEQTSIGCAARGKIKQTHGMVFEFVSQDKYVQAVKRSRAEELERLHGK